MTLINHFYSFWCNIATLIFSLNTDRNNFADTTGDTLYFIFKEKRQIKKIAGDILLSKNQNICLDCLIFFLPIFGKINPFGTFDCNVDAQSMHAQSLHTSSVLLNSFVSSVSDALITQRSTIEENFYYNVINSVL